MRVRFADLRSVTRSVTLPAPISATAILVEIAEDLVRDVLANHPDEQTISLRRKTPWCGCWLRSSAPALKRQICSSMRCFRGGCVIEKRC